MSEVKSTASNGGKTMKQNPSVSLKTVDRVEVTTLMDNYVDLLLPSTDTIIRPPLAKEGKINADTFLAEHGLSLLVTVFQNGQKHTILFDTGYTKVGVLHNMEQLGLNIEEIEAIVLSHGHMDHTGSLYNILEKIPGTIPLVLHPGAFQYPRYTRTPDGSKRLFPQTLVKKDLEQKNIEIVESKSPITIADDLIMVTGEVERITQFEKGMPNALVEKDGELVFDPFIDDQAIVVKLRDKGLVVVSGCAHAGIINTLMFAQKTTGEQNIHAVMGGFHLSGPFFDKILDPTVEALKKIDPDVLMPMHCTGWKAIRRFQKEFPESFMLNSVGSKVMLS
jgi:7,8-dihydropterin-6-yl-methyl-4-(beta-D-ribofuranosyl)aminobenzene 5'-phosphate synthase